MQIEIGDSQGVAKDVASACTLRLELVEELTALAYARCNELLHMADLVEMLIDDARVHVLGEESPSRWEGAASSRRHRNAVENIDMLCKAINERAETLGKGVARIRANKEFFLNSAEAVA